MEAFWISLNTITLLLAALYIISFARVYAQFGTMVKITSRVLRELVIFIVFFLFWNLIFSYLAIISGQDLEDDEYGNINYYVAFLLNGFKISIGDMKVPDTQHWTNHLALRSSGESGDEVSS